MKKEINFSVVSGTLLLVWFILSPIISSIVYFKLYEYINIFIFLIFLLTAYSIIGIIFYYLARFLNKKLGLQGYSKKEIIIEEIKSKNKFWSLDVDSVEHANKIINQTSWTFLIMGTITVMLSFLIIQMQYSWLDGLIWIFFGSILTIKRSNWVSVTIVVVSVIGVLATISNKITNSGAGTNIYLSFAILWISIHSLMAIKYLKNKNVISLPKQKYRKVFVVSAWISAGLFILFTTEVLLMMYL